MQTRGQQQDHRTPVALAVRTAPSRPQALAHFRFGDGGGAHDASVAAPATAALELATDQRWLGGDFAAEYWESAGTVSRGATDALCWSATDDLLFMSMAVTNHGDDDPMAASHDAYEHMLAFARAEGYPWLLRLWNFLPQINHGEGDQERYRRFCLGRNLALEEAGIAESELCAATAVGTHGERLLIHCLVGRSRGVPIENPRQVAAYHYPRLYGPRSPSFARALGLDLGGEGTGLFVSGTASIVGHQTIHPGELMPQLDETLLNLQALLGEAAEKLHAPGLARFNGDSLLRVYLRVPERWDEVAARIRECWPEVHLAGLAADICRHDLEVEIEAFHRADR